MSNALDRLFSCGLGSFDWPIMSSNVGIGIGMFSDVLVVSLGSTAILSSAAHFSQRKPHLRKSNRDQQCKDAAEYAQDGRGDSESVGVSKGIVKFGSIDSVQNPCQELEGTCRDLNEPELGS
jgi:hypothetical protein